MGETGLMEKREGGKKMYSGQDKKRQSIFYL